MNRSVARNLYPRRTQSRIRSLPGGMMHWLLLNEEGQVLAENKRVMTREVAEEELTKARGEYRQAQLRKQQQALAVPDKTPPEMHRLMYGAHLRDRKIYPKTKS